MRPRFKSLIFLVALTSRPLMAEIIVDISPLALNSGSSGYVDILIHSDTGTDPLQFYSMDLEITPLAGANSTLAFSATQDEPHLTDTNYIFAGDSFGGGFWSRPTPTTLTSASDFTFSGSDVAVPDSPFALLYQVLVEHTAGPLGSGPGHQFDISVTAFDFEDENFNLITPTFNSGTVTINSAAVPEPGTLSACLVGGLLWILRRRRSHMTQV
ncbi:MAG: PEP-CTERM sorting domain-containing protein [Planctomycetaceae bacterium]|nr:PEP-CTERM sorting domain-containing protein [Planctomycetaceae bacterium]